MVKKDLPAGLFPLNVLFKALTGEAGDSARRRLAPRRKVGGTIRVGNETPLWNRLVAEVQPFLKVRGEKAQLARLLGVHRQAINEYFVSRKRMPDAERTLLLREWLAVRKTGKRAAW